MNGLAGPKLTALRAALRRANAGALLVADPVNMRYLVGSSDASWVVVTPLTAAVMPFGLSEHAFRSSLSAPWRVMRPGGAWKTLAGLLGADRVVRLAYEAHRMSVAGERDLKRHLGAAVLPVATTGLVEGLRETKTAGELAVMERAAAITGEMAVRLPRMLRPRMTEREAAAMLDCTMRRMGADGPAFETIMLFGVKTALPHGRPGDVRLKPGHLVLVDFGAKLDGYHSDCTRVFVCGRPSARQSATYLRVLKAYRRGRRMVKPGVTGGAVDRAARAALGRMAGRFIHGLGHGVGLEIHEGPRLASGVAARLCRGQAVTVEPGVYWPGWGGFRIEDTVLVTATGHRSLTGDPPSRLTSTG